MGKVLRSVGAVVAGLCVGVLVIVLVEMLSSKVYPLPAGLDPSDPAALRAHVSQLPIGAFLFVLFAWGAGSFLGSWLATRLAAGRGIVPGTVVGAVLFASGVANMLMIPHPAWFWVAGILVFPIGTYFGTRTGAPRA